MPQYFYVYASLSEFMQNDNGNGLFHTQTCVWSSFTIVPPIPPKIRGGGSCFWNLDKEGGYEKIAQR